MKTIKLMPDYQCCPLWDMTPGEYGDIDPMTLPIPELLQANSWIGRGFMTKL